MKVSSFKGEIMLKNFNIEKLLNNNFELKIINRGEDYYYNNLIKSIMWKDNNELIATIVGTDIYSVTIKLKNGKIYDFSCDCPYELHCKHEVAVLIYLFENIYEINEMCEYEINQIEKIENTIKQLTNEELKNIIIEYMKQNKSFRNFISKKFKVKN